MAFVHFDGLMEEGNDGQRDGQMDRLTGGWVGYWVDG